MATTQPTPPDSARAPAVPPVLRADARRNLEKLRAAAVEVFRERGLDTPLEDIAQRAGVSTGTLYNRFGSREALIDAVIPDLAAAGLSTVVDGVRGRTDPWERFAGFVEDLCGLQASDPALNDIMSSRFPESEGVTSVCDDALAQASQLIDEAQLAGVLRPDFGADDLFVVLWANANLVRATAQTAPDAWRRSIAFLLDGLRAEAAHELPQDQPGQASARDAIIRTAADDR